MIVAARARHGQAEKAARHGIHAVVPLICMRDFDCAVVVEPWTQAEEAKRRQHFGAHFVIERIGRDLRGYELIVRQVVVKGLDHPVAIQVSTWIRIVSAPHGIEAAVIVLTIARDIQPHSAPALTVLGRS